MVKHLGKLFMKNPLNWLLSTYSFVYYSEQVQLNRPHSYFYKPVLGEPILFAIFFVNQNNDDLNLGYCFETSKH